MSPLRILLPFIFGLNLSISVYSAAPRPNILYLYADDLGWGYIGANGQTQVKTPNLDTIASTGVNFTRGYGNMVCSPARSSQQTGFHQGHTWTDRNDPDSSKAIRADDQTIGDMLSGAGYRTAYFGKWGYGADQTIQPSTTRRLFRSITVTMLFLLNYTTSAPIPFSSPRFGDQIPMMLSRQRRWSPIRSHPTIRITRTTPPTKMIRVIPPRHTATTRMLLAHSISFAPKHRTPPHHSFVYSPFRSPTHH